MALRLYLVVPDDGNVDRHVSMSVYIFVRRGSPRSTPLQGSLRAADRYSHSRAAKGVTVALPVVPPDGNVSVHASMPIYISAGRGLIHLYNNLKYYDFFSKMSVQISSNF